MKLTGLWQYHVVHLQAPLFQTSVSWVWKKMEYAKSLVRGTLSTGFVRPQRPYRRPRSLRAAKFLHDLSDWGFVRQNSRSHFGTVLWNCNCLKIEGSHQQKPCWLGSLQPQWMDRAMPGFMNSCASQQGHLAPWQKCHESLQGYCTSFACFHRLQSV